VCNTPWAAFPGKKDGNNARRLASMWVERVSRSFHLLREICPNSGLEWMLVIGVIVGSFLSAKLSGQFQIQWIPGQWSALFGSAFLPRWLVALIGGIIMGFGARWAGGCTSGHGISGTLQLAVSSWLAAICFFIGGIATAMAIVTFLAV